MIDAQKNLLVAVVKNLPAHIVKTELAHQAYQARVKQHKLALIASAQTVLKKAVMPVNLKEKIQALEIQIPTLHVVLDVVSSEANVKKLRIGTTKL